MLKRIACQLNTDDVKVKMEDASFPSPFESRLEFNAPAHGNWNIVHIGMLIPEAHQIYVCADNCMRGVVLTAAEMNASDRFSSVVLEEQDLYEGNLEEITIEGITDVLQKLEKEGKLPPAVLVFPVCLHHFMGSDMSRVYAELEERFPTIRFARCWMDPIMQKTGLTPDQKERNALPDMIDALPENNKVVCMMNDNLRLEESSEMAVLLKAYGYELRQVQDMKRFDEYLSMGEGTLFITRSAAGLFGTERFSKRVGRKFLYLPPSIGYDEIADELRQLAEVLVPRGIAADCQEVDAACQKSDVAAGQGQIVSMDMASWMDERKEACEQALAKARACIGDTPVCIDYMAVNRPLGLARLLLEHGFCVKRVYLDAISPEEEADFGWLQKNAPMLELNATVHVKMRSLHKPFLMNASNGTKEQNCEVLAIGPKAAWFEGTENFVDLIEYGGMWGFDGIIRLCELMMDAYENRKDVRKIIPRKGWGCDCIL